MPFEMKNPEKQPRYNYLFGKYFSRKGLTEKEMHEYHGMLINRVGGDKRIQHAATEIRSNMNKLPLVGEQNIDNVKGEVL